NTPSNVDYLRIQWENPTGSSPITHYNVYRFATGNETDTLNPVDSVINYPYNENNNYNAYFSSLSLDTDVFFRIVSLNSSDRSTYSDVTSGFIDTGFDCDTSDATGTSTNIVWTSKFPGETTHRWVKLCSSPADLLSINENRYRDGGEYSTSTVEIEITGLQVNTHYYYFAFEINENGDCISSDSCSFNTPEEQEPEDPDPHEPNNTFGEATSLTIGSWMNNCYIYPLNDLDNFSINITDHSSTYEVGLENNTSFSLNLYLFNNSGSQINSETISAGSSFSDPDFFSPDVNGIFYFRIESTGNFSHLESFSLIVTYANEDPYEDNNSFLYATETTPGLPYSAYIQEIDDEDHYKFNCGKGDISIDLENTLNIDLNAELYDSDTVTVLNSGHTSSGNLTLEYTNNGSDTKTFYLKLKAYNSGEFDSLNAYNFTVTFTPYTNGDDNVDIGVVDNYYKKGVNTTPGFEFLGLKSGYSVQILGLNLQKIKKINYNPGGTIWSLKNENGKEVASGVYYYIVIDKNTKMIYQNKLIYIK
ncbi:MAG: hypothetical protein KAR38_04510, partial [Calditrichia bacterium]|nr:hypothetical protein [Calditrichia bacterium]